MQGRLLRLHEELTVRHHIQDAYDARERATGSPTPTWHPMLAADEAEPGLWLMRAWDARPYAIVRAIEIGGERGYRATTWAENPADRALIGYWRTFRVACMGAHRAYLRTHGAGRASNHDRPLWG
ncbi:hypothetical protein [Salinibacterium sp. ZJ77]|uniref:hypothetical protein n=1 Tax=Salinibacterium sp. ZJ77 TaxID=2708337 RepID=UPI00141FBC57|nr:hypothetical protein [Salinibacterium sp. ZJ77]